MNNTKRILFILLLLVGIVGIAATIYFLFLKKSSIGQPVAPVAQPVATLPSTKPVTTAPAVSAPPTKVVPPSADSPAEIERKAREALYRRARDLSSRLGSYGNADGFAALSSVYADVTPDVKTYLVQQVADLTTAHPTRGESYSVAAHALGARLTQDVMVSTATNVEVIVDIQQQTETGSTKTNTLKQAILTFTKSGNVWIVSHVTWQDAQF